MGRKKNKEISAALFKKIEPLLPAFTPSAKGGCPQVSDELALNGILFVLRTGIPWEELPQELGFGSGMTCWRLRQWQDTGVWHQLHLLLLAELRGAGRLDFSRASLDAASAPSPWGARTRGPIPRTGGNSAASVTSSRTACCREHLRRRGIKERIARRAIERNDRLGRHRWVVERTHAWLASFGKLRVRLERSVHTHVALLSLACSVICLRSLMRLC